MNMPLATNASVARRRAASRRSSRRSGASGGAAQSFIVSSGSMLGNQRPKSINWQRCDKAVNLQSRDAKMHQLGGTYEGS
jgi:hypothetical protein